MERQNIVSVCIGNQITFAIAGGSRFLRLFCPGTAVRAKSHIIPIAESDKLGAIMDNLLPTSVCAELCPAGPVGAVIAFIQCSNNDKLTAAKNYGCRQITASGIWQSKGRPVHPVRAICAFGYPVVFGRWNGDKFPIAVANGSPFLGRRQSSDIEKIILNSFQFTFWSLALPK